MDKTKAEREIKLIGGGLIFDYKIDMNIINKRTFCIEKEVYSIPNIISKLKIGEKLLFYLNDGFQVKEREGSIYWKNDIYGECVRVDSDMDSIKNWCDEIELKNKLL